MKLNTKRIIFSITSVILVLSTLFSLAVSVSAEETSQVYKPTNPYVLKFDTSNKDKVYCYAQFSPFVPKLSYGDEIISGYSIIFGLYDEYNDVAFESLYCTDMPVDAVTSGYRRINLTDSTYASSLANKLRAILFNTYPYKTVEDVASESGIEGLTLGETITASQLAVWKTAHGDIVEIKDFLSYVVSGNSSPSEIQNKLHKELDNYSSGSNEHKASVKNNIEALYDYLISLNEVAPLKQVVSESSFIERDTAPMITSNGDGTYDITVNVKVNVALTEGDELTLTAYVADGKYFVSKSLKDGESSHKLTIENVPASAAFDTVTVAIDGKQDAPEDVYLIDANGIRGASQSMVGIFGGILPVHAETKIEPDRVLNIYKTELINSDGGTEASNRRPLSNISFDIYYVGSVEDFRDGKLNIGAVPSDEDVKKFAVGSNMVGTVTTDETGKASMNFGTSDGVYLIVELPNDSVEEPMSPFFVSLPDWSKTDANGNPVYEITAEPKNTVINETPDIKKDVTDIDNEHDTFNVGDEHTWIIRTTLPKTLSAGKSYIITDTLDYRLTYSAFLKAELVNVNSDSSEAVGLENGTDYTIIYEKVTDSEGRLTDKLTVSLTKDGMKKAASVAGNDYSDFELRFFFAAKINQNAVMGENINNRAKVEFTNNVGKTFEDESDAPEVHTGGIQLIKVDASDTSKTLAGATFELYREATNEDLTAGTDYTTVMIGETERKLIKVSFYDNASLSGEKSYTLITGDDGKGFIYGLAYGDYYLIEVSAPDGYNKLASPVKFTVNETSHTDEHKLVITNTSGVELPSTGGAGTAIFTVLGSLTVLAAVVLLVCEKRMRS